MDTVNDSTNRPVIFWALAFVIIIVALTVLWPFLDALFWATVLAVLFTPTYKRLKRKMPPSIAAFLATMLATFAVILPFAVGTTFLVREVVDFSETYVVDDMSTAEGFVQGLTRLAEDRLEPALERIGLGQLEVASVLRDNENELVNNLTGPILRLTGSLLFGLLNIIIALILTFFLLRDGHKLMQPMKELIPLPAKETELIAKRCGDTIWAVFVGVVLVAILQGLLALVSYLIVGMPAAVFLGFITIFLCMVPLAGAPVVYVPYTIWLIMQGEFGKAIFLFTYGVLVVSMLDNWLRPIVIGARVAMHPMAVFFALIGGVIAFGPVGIMVGPVILALLQALSDVIRSRRRVADDDIPQAEFEPSKAGG